MKKAVMGLVAAMVLLAPAVAAAYSAENQHDLTLPKGETKTGTYYAAGQTVTIDGDVDGDLICAGQTVSVNGNVHGDVICAGQSVTVNGTVDGSVRLGGQDVIVNGSVGRNVTVAAQSFTLSQGSHVSGDLGVLSQTAAVNGSVDRDVYGRMQSLALGASSGAVSVTTGALTMSGDAKVNGNLHYESENSFNIDKSKVTGDISHSTPPARDMRNADNAAQAGFALRLYWIFAGLILGLAFVWLMPGLVRRASGIMREKPGKSIGWGVIVSLVGPALALVLMVTVLGLPLGLLVGVAWLLLVLTSSIFAGIAAGLWLLDRAEWERGSLWWAAALGVPLTVIVLSVPFVGGIIGLVATWWAVGGVSLAARAARS
ncbi:MAG TPA: polymer-forming cytoskeletal protein [Candidatus Saccharimonadia bacterium]|jgi:hypothetical protein